ncbi:hypothetical protein GOODEAATRI_028849, partial [Goodea atripinnis]
MAPFAEVLDQVRLVLTWAFPGEVQALLKGLVKEGIISEVYRKSLNLHWLNDGIVPTLTSKPGWFDCTLRSSDEKVELLSSANSASASDNERVSMENLENEEEWLEQVEEAARRIAVPLWQHWDRGRGMLQTLLLCVPSTLVNDGMVSEVEAQCAIFDTEEKMELAAACRTPDACVGDFECAEPSLTCDTAAGRSERGELHFSTNNRIAVLNTEDFRIHRAARSASPVEACKATDASYITEMLESQFDIFWPPDKMADVEDDLFCLTANTLCKQCGTNSGLSESTFRHLLYSDAPEDRRTVLQDNSHYSLTERKTDYLQDVFRDTAASCIDRFRELHEKMDSHGGKFGLCKTDRGLVLFIIGEQVGQ